MPCPPKKCKNAQKPDSIKLPALAPHGQRMLSCQPCGGRIVKRNSRRNTGSPCVSTWKTSLSAPPTSRPLFTPPNGLALPVFSTISARHPRHSKPTFSAATASTPRITAHRENRRPIPEPAPPGHWTNTGQSGACSPILYWVIMPVCPTGSAECNPMARWLSGWNQPVTNFELQTTGIPDSIYPRNRPHLRAK